jgi:hypothetical protein
MHSLKGVKIDSLNTQKYSKLESSKISGGRTPWSVRSLLGFLWIVRLEGGAQNLMLRRSR